MTQVPLPRDSHKGNGKVQNMWFRHCPWNSNKLEAMLNNWISSILFRNIRGKLHHEKNHNMHYHLCVDFSGVAEWTFSFPGMSNNPYDWNMEYGRGRVAGLWVPGLVHSSQLNYVWLGGWLNCHLCESSLDKAIKQNSQKKSVMA